MKYIKWIGAAILVAITVLMMYLNRRAIIRDERKAAASA